jgi:hypothetical protein
MAKFINLWEVEVSKMPVDPNERAKIIATQIGTVKKMRAEGKLADWGIFAGGAAGYGIAEGTPSDVLKLTMPFAPYIKSHVHPVLSIEEAEAVLKSLSGQA